MWGTGGIGTQGTVKLSKKKWMKSQSHENKYFQRTKFMICKAEGPSVAWVNPSEM